MELIKRHTSQSTIRDGRILTGKLSKAAWDEKSNGLAFPLLPLTLEEEKRRAHTTPDSWVGGKTQVSVACCQEAMSLLLRTSPVDGSHVASLPSLITILCQAAEQHFEGFSKGGGAFLPKPWSSNQMQSRSNSTQAFPSSSRREILELAPKDKNRILEIVWILVFFSGERVFSIKRRPLEKRWYFPLQLKSLFIC